MRAQEPVDPGTGLTPAVGRPGIWTAGAPDLPGHGSQRDRPFSLEEAVGRVSLGYGGLFHVQGPHHMSISEPDAFTRIVERGYELLSGARPDAFSPPRETA